MPTRNTRSLATAREKSRRAGLIALPAGRNSMIEDINSAGLDATARPLRYRWVLSYVTNTPVARYDGRLRTVEAMWNRP
jgi:hypothetical protein